MLGGIGMNNKAEYTPEKVVDISNLSREDCLDYRNPEDPQGDGR